jgi:nucleoside-triphosphatase THEP1
MKPTIKSILESIDEFAEVISIGEKGEMELEFKEVDEKVQEFLRGAEFNVKDYQDCIVK